MKVVSTHGLDWSGQPCLPTSMHITHESCCYDYKAMPTEHLVIIKLWLVNVLYLTQNISCVTLCEESNNDPDIPLSDGSQGPTQVGIAGKCTSECQ